jgi:uncharacterized protein YicC (UPF0701 family)
MDPHEMEARIKNIDERTARIEQILPTLATKDDLATLATKEEIATLATKDQIATLATKDDLATRVSKDELREAVALLATREDMYEEGERTRRHFDVVAESLRHDIGLIAESQLALEQRVDAKLRGRS